MSKPRCSVVLILLVTASGNGGAGRGANRVRVAVPRRRSAGSAGRLGLPHADAARAARGSRRPVAVDAGRGGGDRARGGAARHRGGPADRNPDGAVAGRRQRRQLQRFLERPRAPRGRRPATSLIVHPPDGRVRSPWPGRGSSSWPPTTTTRRRRTSPCGSWWAVSRHGPEARGLAERCLLGFNSGPPIVPAPGAATTSTCSSVRRRTTWSSSPRWCTRRASCTSMGGTAAGRHPSVDGQLARPLGRRHAGGRDDQLHRQDGELRPVHAPRDRDGPDAASDRAVSARRRGHAPLRVHHRRPGELHATVHRCDSNEAQRRAPLRVRVSRGQLRHAEPAVGRPRPGEAGVRARTSYSRRVARTAPAVRWSSRPPGRNSRLPPQPRFLR